MAKFEMSSWGFYEIDFFDDEEEISHLMKKLNMNHNDVAGCYYLVGLNWHSRIGGMSFNIESSEYYEKLKKYLDDRLQKHLRKEKIIKLSS